MAEPPEPASDENVEARVTDLVMAYLAAHPSAMDTASGILEWWLPPDSERVDLRTVERVLDKLVEQGLLERVRSGAYRHYRLKSG